jgi:ribonucleoside-diphosphate reductase alpha chain
MFKQNISWEVWGGDNGKYRLKDPDGTIIDQTPEDTCLRVANGLSELEKDSALWKNEFLRLISSGRMAGGGRIMANVGSGSYKRDASPINCVVLRQIPDSMEGIMQTAKEAAMTLRAGCGVGYDFSTIRSKGAFVYGAGAETSGVISFMKIFDATCGTVMSGGGRRGAQMGCLDIQHPEIESFITCKRQDGVLRYFNLSVLITDAFMKAVVNDEQWQLWFWEKCERCEDDEQVVLIEKGDIPFRHSDSEHFKFAEDHTEVVSGNCTTDTIFKKRVFKVMPAKELFDKIMKSTYDFAEPGFILVDRINKENNLWFCEIHRACNPCGEQNLPPNGSCLLGSMILPPYVINPFAKNVEFDWDSFIEDVRTANRLLDNVVDLNNLPLPELSKQIIQKRRHGLGFTGLGSTFNMMRISYGSDESIEFSDKLAYTLAETSLLENIALAKEKGCAPIFEGKENRKKFCESGYMKRLLNEICVRRSHDFKQEVVADIERFGLRYSHATSIAPTGTMSLTWGNNCSNGIEPSFSNSYMRNIRQAGKKTKVQEEVMSYEYWLWKELNRDKELPDWWRVTDDLSVDNHIIIQAAAQKWVDSAISKCVAKGTLINTDKGIFKIEDLSDYCYEDADSFSKTNKDYHVIDSAGEKRKVMNHYYGGVKPCLEVSFDNGFSVTTSETHSFLTDQGWTKAGALTVGDRIRCLSGKLQIDNKKVMLPELKHHRNANKSIALPKFVDESFAKFVGMWLANGSNNGNSILIHEKSPEVSREVSVVCKSLKWKVDISVDKRTGVRSHRINSRALCRFFDENIGRGCRDKKIPDFILSSGEDIQMAFLSGISLDGYIGRGRLFLYEGYSKNIAVGISYIISQNGYQYYLGEKTNSNNQYGEARASYSVAAYFDDYFVDPIENHKKEYDFSLRCGNQIFVSEDEQYDIINSFEHSKEDSWRRRNARSRFKKSNYISREFLERNLKYKYEDENFSPYSVRISNIEDVGNKEVYDIEVEETHSYLINGLISHNTANVPTDYPFEDFKEIYIKGWQMGLKGVTTFRFNPEAFSGVLVRKEDLENTEYVFVLEGNKEIVVKGDDQIEYDGEIHNAANLFDALKEGMYGDM